MVQREMGHSRWDDRETEKSQDGQVLVHAETGSTM